ncbi:MAG: amino acid permease [Phycisphaeraceae bacterium]|nr:amino acid permease [Phycisphaeraceae bacterium]
MANAQSPVKAGSGARLGTFAGVFTPSILTILGIILFQRFGFVVGAGGLLRALGIVALATCVSILTSLSLAAIATNLRIKGGGDYYLISRTLGVQFGGAIGLVLFLAQSVSVAFYCIGFGEAVAALFGQAGEPAVVAGIAAVATLLVGTIAYVGADLATRFQFVVMGALVVALGSFYVGAFGLASERTLVASLTPPEDGSGFWILFAIFFPAVTGFTQGVSMSGDLRDSARSLPRGTFWAVGVSTAVYVSIALLLAASMPLSELASDYGAFRRVAAVPWLIDVGVIAATLSSAMASFLGGPRIMQSLARDEVIPPLRAFAKGSGPSENPRRAVLLAGAIALTTISLGNLNAIASLVGMCFLLSYGLINYATFFEARANSPAFRPRFKIYSAWLSLAGALLCVACGVAISPFAAAVAGALMVALYQYLSRTSPQSAWADSRYASHVRQVRDHLVAIRDGSSHPRDWRPHVLAVCNEPSDRARLLRFASWIDGDSGFTTAVQIVVQTDAGTPARTAAAEESFRAEVRGAGLQTFTRVVSAPSILDGFTMVTQAHGLGPLRANTILMSADEHLGEPVWAGEAPPAEALDAALHQGRNVILLEARPEAWERMLAVPEDDRVIDVWWQDDTTSSLSLMLAHLMTRSAGWRDAQIRIHAIAQGSHDQHTTLQKVEEMLENVRIEARVDVVEFEGPRTLLEHSRNASVVFIPLRIRGRRLVGPKGGSLSAVLADLPVTALAVAGEDIDLDAEPEDPPAKTGADRPVSGGAEVVGASPP